MAENKQKRRSGILGGTFNPVHTGHLILAENADEQFNLDKVIFLPSGNPPHKENVSYISAKHRAKMVEIAIEDNNHFEMSLEEIEREGITYTSDTLTLMHEREPLNELFFILGADSLFTFEYWHEPDIICKHCTILVATREELNPKEVEEKIAYLQNKFDVNVYRIISPDFDISSNLIRHRVFDNKSIKYFTPDKVVEYINNNNLYKELI